MVNMIKTLFEGFSCQVIHNGRLSDEFEISSGVKHSSYFFWYSTGLLGHLMQTPTRESLMIKLEDL